MNRLFLTADERIKLYNIGNIIQYSLPKIEIKTSGNEIKIYHIPLSEKLMDLNPKIVMLRRRRISAHKKSNRKKTSQWVEIRNKTIGLSRRPDATDFFRFQLLNTGKWHSLSRESGYVDIPELVKAFIAQSLTLPGMYSVTFATGLQRYVPINGSFKRTGLFALAIRIDNPDFPKIIHDRPVNNSEYRVAGFPRYLYSSPAQFKLSFAQNYPMPVEYSLIVE